MKNKKDRVCPVELAGSLDTRLRRWIQNPRKILSPYIKEGMTVLDFGCGPGFFTLEMAQLVGKTGRVIASDLQEGMLQILKQKIQGTELAERITLHHCEENTIGLKEEIDFALAFYVLHEIPDQSGFFSELSSLLLKDAKVLIVEPPFHVSRTGFAGMIERAAANGLHPLTGGKILFNKTVLLEKA